MPGAEDVVALPRLSGNIAGAFLLLVLDRVAEFASILDQETIAVTTGRNPVATDGSGRFAKPRETAEGVYFSAASIG